MDINEKQNILIKRLSVLLGVVFVIIIGIVIWLCYDKFYNKPKSTNKIQIQKTTTVSSGGETKIIDVSDVVSNAMPCIVAITSKTKVTSPYGPYYFGYNKEQYSTGAGSGIIINKTDKELMILTNYHVIEGAEKLTVQFINNKSVDASVIGSYETRDIAVISVKLSDLDGDTIKKIRIATLGDSTKLKVGEGIIAIGNALGYGQSVTTGVISALNREVTIDKTTNNMIQIDAAINGGNSGGALLNSKGEVIGINSAKYSNNSSSGSSIEGMGFAIPISDVEELINKILNGETLSEKERGYLGISGYMITKEYSNYYGIPMGIYIREISSNSNAESAGLKVGDIITSVEGTKVTSFSVLSEKLIDKKAGEKISLVVKSKENNGYKDKEIKVVLSNYDDVNK